MDPVPSPLDRPVSIPIIRRLLAAKALTAQEAGAMESRLRRDLPWRPFIDRGLLSLGAVLILAGIGYFFAHNWGHLTNNEKLELAGGAVLASLVGATWAGLDRFPGKLLLLAASALVGVYLAVFGQVYQTGADSYELFAGWAILILPWVALGRFMPLWIFWLGLLNLTLGFYWPASDFFPVFKYWDAFLEQAVSLLLLNGAALLLREALDQRAIPWFDRRWSALTLLAATLIPATTAAIRELFHEWYINAEGLSALIALVTYAAFVVGLGYYYTRARYSLPALALTTLGGCLVLSVLAIRLLFNSGTWFLAGLAILAIFSGGIFFLRTQRLLHLNAKS